MGFTGSSEPSSILRTVLRAAVEGAAVGGLGAAVCVAVFRAPQAREGILLGMASAWLASTASAAMLLWSRGRSVKAFWRAFGGGVALRLAALGILMGVSWGRGDAFRETLLISYVFGVLAMLLTMEIRHLRSVSEQ